VPKKLKKQKSSSESDDKTLLAGTATKLDFYSDKMSGMSTAQRRRSQDMMSRSSTDMPLFAFSNFGEGQHVLVRVTVEIENHR